MSLICHAKTKDKYATSYQVFTGGGTIFEGPEGISIAEIPDGTSNTTMIAEAAEAVPWTKPVDLTYNAKEPLPKLGGLFKDGFNMAFADGSVHWVKKDVKPEWLRAAITRNGGEVFQD